MQIIFIVLCLFLNRVISQAPTNSQPPNQQTPGFTCEELTSNIHTLKNSTVSKKERFSCILNLLKSALTDELESSQPQEETHKADCSNKLQEDGSINDNTRKDDRESIIEEKDMNANSKASDRKKNNKNNNNMEVPTMIPIFKPKPMNELLDKPYPSRIRSTNENANPNLIPNSPRFTIPCQRAADILDMSIPMMDHEKIQTNLKPVAPATSFDLANQKPPTIVHCEDLEDSVSVLFKPKAISLMQVYGNLLKKITITVLVPYHMSKIGQKQ